MKTLFSIVLLAMIMAISPLVFADTVADHTADAMTGKNQYIATSAYIAYTTKEAIKIGEIPIVPKGIRVKLGTPIGNGSFRTGTLEVGWEL